MKKMDKFSRRTFGKTLALSASFLAASRIMAASGVPRLLAPENNWPTETLGGDEKIYLSEQDIVAMRQRIDVYPWAQARFDALKDLVANTNSSDNQFAKDIALYYRLTGDDSKLNLVKEALVDKFNLDNMGSDLVNGRTWKSWGRTKASYYHAWDLVNKSPVMSEIDTRMDTRLNELASEFLKEDLGSFGNTDTWAICGMGLTGLLTGNQEAIDGALDNKTGVKAWLENHLREGKFFFDPLQYGWKYVLLTMTILAQAYKQSGIENLYQYSSPSGHTIKGMADGYLELCNPTGELVGGGDQSYVAQIYGSDGQVAYEATNDDTFVMHDGNGGSLFGPGCRTNLFEILYAEYQDPKYAWCIAQSPERHIYHDHDEVRTWGDTTLSHGLSLSAPVAPDFKNSAFQDMGHALLSDVEGPGYWLGNNMALHVRNGCANGTHSHDDPFHFDLYAKGKMLYADWFHKSHEYLSPDEDCPMPIHKYSIGHNTVSVDKKGPDVKRVGTRDIVNDVDFSEITTQGPLKVISLHGSPWGGVEMRRTFGLSSSYLVDVFECDSNDQHTYDYFLRDHGQLVLDEALDTQPYSGFKNDYDLDVIDTRSSRNDNEWLREGLKATTGSNWQGSFVGTPDGLPGTEKRSHLFVGAEPDTEVFKSDTPLLVWQGWDETPSDIRAMSRGVLIMRRRAKSTKFVVVHQLDNLDKKYDVQIEGTSISIKGDGFEHSFVVENGEITNLLVSVKLPEFKSNLKTKSSFADYGTAIP